MLKKVFCVFLCFVIFLMSLPFAVLGVINEDKWSDYVTLGSSSAVLDKENSSITNGKAVLKVTLPAGSYIQFNQKLTDLVAEEIVGESNVKIEVGNCTEDDYRNAMVQLQLLGSAEIQEDITPVDEANGKDPGKNAMTWLFFGSTSKSNFRVNNGSSTAYYTNFGYVTNMSADSSNHAIPVYFTEESSGSVTVSHQYNTVSGYASHACASKYTLEDIGAIDGVYLRLRNAASSEVTYTLTINSSDISSSYVQSGWTISDMGSVINSQSTTVESGIITEKFSVTLSPNGGYAQFNKLLTSVIGKGSLGDDIRIKVGSHSKDDYGTCDFNLQLTTDAEAKTDITPVDEANGHTPSNSALTWRFKGNTEVYVGKGSSTTNAAIFENSRSVIVSQGGLFPAFKLNTTDGLVYMSSNNTSLDIASGNGIAPTNTLESINGQDGVFLRIRNNKDTAVTYELKFSYSDGAYIQGRYTVSDIDSTILQQSSSTSENIVTETVTATLSGAGSYIQLNELLSDLVDGTGTVSVIVGDNKDYSTANLQLQLTDDKSASTDIVPVNENSTDPGTDGMTWLFLGYPAHSVMYTGRGNTTANGGTYGYLSNIPNQNGIKIKFYTDDNKKVNIKSWHGGLTLDNSLPSTKTLADIGGDDGVYLRLRNVADTPVTYTLVITYQVENESQPDNEPTVWVPYTDGNWSFSDTDSKLKTSNSASISGDADETASITLSPGGWAQFNVKMKNFINNGQINLVVGNNTVDDYNSARVQVQLTANADATTDIVPVDERSNDPGTEGMTWLFYGANQYIYTGRGSTTAGGAGYFGAPSIPGQGGIQIRFNRSKVSDKISMYGLFTGVYVNESLPSTKTLTEINGNEGVYVRIRNTADTTVTYTVSVCEITKESATNSATDPTEEANAFTKSMVESKDEILENNEVILSSLSSDWNALSFTDKLSTELYIIGDSASIQLLDLVKKYASSQTTHLYPEVPDDTTPTDLTGDVNNDGVVDFEDLIELRKILLKGDNNGDVNKDGKTNICDLVSLNGLI